MASPRLANLLMPGRLRIDCQRLLPGLRSTRNRPA